MDRDTPARAERETKSHVSDQFQILGITQDFVSEGELCG